MAYNSDIPQASDDPSQSQGQILGNFQELNTFLSVNHIDLNDADQGKHKFLQLPEQGSAPATAANEGAIYTKVVSAATQLFFREESSGTERQITSPFTTTNPGSLTIPGGLGFRWGSGSGTTATFVPAFSSTILVVLVTVRSPSANQPVVATKTITEFTLDDSAEFDYIAIGL